MRVVITGGGTGGHIYPALSVAELLDSCEIDFVGSAAGPEATIVPRHGYRFHGLPARKLSRRPGLGAVVSLAVAGLGVLHAARLIRQLRPDVVFGTGGYASGPLMLAATLMRVPTLIHEGNSIPGRTNRMMGRFVRRVAISFEEARPYFPARKTVLTGFPIRGSIRNGRAERARAIFGLNEGPLVFVFGGSRGAESINRAVGEALPLLAGLGAQVLHQTGRGSAEATSGGVDERTSGRADESGSSSPPFVHSSVQTSPDWYHPREYVEEMADALAAADVVVCRAGASTLAEVTAVGRAAVLVPYPHAHADHQTGNARSLVDAGAALLVPDAELDGERLAAEIGSLLAAGERRGRMAAASRGLARPEAARQVADEIRRLSGTAAPGAQQSGDESREYGVAG